MYELRESKIKLCQGKSLYSETPITNPEIAVEVLAREISESDREIVIVINLDNGNRPIDYNVVSVGNINSSIFSMPNIFKAAILQNARSIIMMHNHPSQGKPIPSNEDICVTEKITEVGKLLSINLLDHIIVSSDNWHTSLREENYITF